MALLLLWLSCFCVCAQEITTEKSEFIEELYLKEMEVLDVLKLLSEKTSTNIVSGNNVRGKVTIFLKDVELDEALKTILKANQLAYVRENNIIRVMTADEYEQRFGFSFGTNLEYKMFRLKHARASDIEAALQQFRTPQGKIIVDSVSNSIAVEDAPARVKMIKDWISKSKAEPI